MRCKEGHRIDDTNESYGGVICGGCGETIGTESDFAIDWSVDDFDPILDALADLSLDGTYPQDAGDAGSVCALSRPVCSLLPFLRRPC